MNWDFIALSFIYFRTALILFDLKNLNLSKHIEHLIREHPCVLIDSGDMYANSIRKTTSVLISILT